MNIPNNIAKIIAEKIPSKVIDFNKGEFASIRLYWMKDEGINGFQCIGVCYLGKELVGTHKTQGEGFDKAAATLAILLERIGLIVTGIDPDGEGTLNHFHIGGNYYNIEPGQFCYRDSGIVNHE